MSLRSKAILGVILAIAMARRAGAQDPVGSVGAGWDALLQGAIPRATSDTVLMQPQVPVPKGPAGDFLNHFMFESRSEYLHADTVFTGKPTLTGLTNAPFTPVFNPNGFPYQAAFQPDANRFYTFWDWGTRGWGSDRVDSHFSARYRTDLTPVDLASPNANILETFDHNRQIEFLTGSITIHGLRADGAFAGATVELGRQHVYGAEVADIDGANVTISRQQFSFNLFGGRRFTYYSDPERRAIGGGGATWRPDARTSLSYDVLVYIHGSHRISFRRRITSTLSLISYLRVYGGAPVDFKADILYQLRNGKTTLRGGFFQKLTDKDYTYDYTEGARDLSQSNKLYRLYFDPIQPYTQVSVDARHSFARWLSMSATVIVRQLNNDADQSAFNNSFQDYRVNAQAFPIRRLQASLEYHQNNTDRLPADPNRTFDDVSRAGQTSVKDLSSELTRSFGEGGRLTLSGGVYYRRLNVQDGFQRTTGAHQSGWLGGIAIKADRHTRVYFDYALDNDFVVLQPDIQKGRILRVGLVWKY